MIVLGVETSCDETGIALVSDGKDVLAEQLASQEEIHAPYAGVVPELASRQHIKLLGPLFQSALAESGCALHQIGLVGVTKGPGLVGCLLTGVSFAKGIAYGLGVPVLGINHIEAHIHSCFLDGVVDYPALALVISGGHTLLALIEAWGKYRRIGHTLDDAAGEAYDKVASKLGLAFPGGPAIEARARRGRAALKRSKTGRQGPRFPRPLLKSENFDFSFSGLKTAVLYWLKSRGTAPLGEDVVDMVAAAFEDAVIEVLLKKTLGAATHFGTRTILLAGGVAQNESLRTAFRKEVQSVGMRLVCPAKKYCGDNAVMVAALAYCRYAAGERDDWSLDVAPGLRLC